MTRAPLSSPSADGGPSPPAARQALLSAFAKLALTRRYGDINVEAIVRAANVARSTFYYHFAGKDELLLDNLRPLLSALARMPFRAQATQELETWIAHVWEQRALAVRLLGGPAGAKIEAALVAGLREAFAAEIPELTQSLRRPLLAEQIAGASLTLLKAWVSHRVSASPRDLANTLWRSARSIALSAQEQ